MGIKPAKEGLNVALKQIFANIDNIHLIHDNLTIATTMKEYIQIISYVMEVISATGLT